MVFVEEEFLHKKISNKDVYVDHSAMANIPEDAVKQYEFDSIEVGEAS